MRRFIGAVIGLTVAVAVAVVAFLQPALLRDLELKLLDVRFWIRHRAPITDQAVVVAVDARSIREMGRWPWPREVVARLLDRLCEEGVKVAAFDIVFSEAQREPLHDAALNLRKVPGLPPVARTDLDAILSTPTGDEALAGAVRSCADRTVLGYFFRQEESVGGGPDDVNRFLARAAIPVTLVRNPDFWVPSALDVEENIPALTQPARHEGFFNLLPDPDGQLRHYQLVWRYKDSYFPALAVAAMQLYLGNEEPIRLSVDRAGEVSLTVSGRPVYTDEEGREILDFRGPGGTLRHVSAADVLDGKPNLNLQGRIAFIGVTEVGIKDVRPTPLDPLFPGTEVHATVADSILRGEYLRRTGNEILLDLATILLLGLFLGIALQFSPRAHRALLVTAGIAVIYCVFNQFAFVRLHLWVNAIYPLITIASTYTAMTLYRALAVERKARQVRDVFQKYVAPAIVEEMLSDPSRVRLGGEKRVLTVLFSDIRGFTSISEQMDPQGVVQFLNSYFTPMTQIILDHRGTFDKYMGDAIMAFWGAPLEMEDHASQCCRAALAMCRQLDAMRKQTTGVDLSHLDVGIGINTGPVSVGNMGSEQIYDYTVIGDTANLASRLEGANKTYGTRIIISESTHGEIGEDFLTRRLDRVRVKGKAQPVPILELLGDASSRPEWESFLATFEAGLDAYYATRFSEALEAFRSAGGMRPEDEPSRIYVKRCESFLESPPPTDWDGVYVMTSK